MAYALTLNNRTGMVWDREFPSKREANAWRKRHGQSVIETGLETGSIIAGEYIFWLVAKDA